MQIRLTQSEVAEILRKHFNRDEDISFTVFYTEPIDVWEARTGKRMYEQVSTPDDIMKVNLYF